MSNAKLSHGERFKILTRIKKLVLTQHINVGGIDYADWIGQVDAKTPGLLSSEIPEFEAGVRELLTQGRAHRRYCEHRGQRGGQDDASCLHPPTLRRGWFLVHGDGTGPCEAPTTRNGGAPKAGLFAACRPITGESQIRRPLPTPFPTRWFRWG